MLREMTDEQKQIDRTVLCQLFDYVGVLGDDEWLRVHWTEDECYSSFVSLIGTIFDDFNIEWYAQMHAGYLGTPHSIPQMLRNIARSLGDFWKAHLSGDLSDLELLALPDWAPISLAAKAMTEATQAWREENCAK